MIRASLWTVALAAMVSVAGMASMTGAADKTPRSKPFKISGGGIAPIGLQPLTPHDIEGTATHLGKHTGQGSFDILSLAPSSPTTLSGTFASHDPCVFVAANGDQLICHYGNTDKGALTVGTFEINILDVTAEGLLVEAEFIAEFVPQPESTGRFAGASGSWIMYASTEPFVFGSSDPAAYYWEGKGTLTLP